MQSGTLVTRIGNTFKVYRSKCRHYYLVLMLDGKEVIKHRTTLKHIKENYTLEV